MLPNLTDNVEDKGKDGWAKGLDDETRDRGKPLKPMKKGIREGKEWNSSLSTKKSDTTYRPFSGDAPQSLLGDGVIPW